MALKLYPAASNDSTMGPREGGQVVMSRVYDYRVTDYVCDGIHQGKHYNGYPVRNRCQFSWYCDGKSDKPREAYAWAYAQMVAADTLIGQGIDVTDMTQGATHYHANYVRPYWADKLEYTVTYGSHLFYK